jgi:hypothetical protein
MTKYLIWWTSQADHERVTPLDTWPSWLYDEFRSRAGRAGRGRLWVSSKFKDAPEEAAWDESKWTCQIANDAGGIVIPLGDLHHVWMLPGFITDFSMASPSLTDLVETAPAD